MRRVLIDDHAAVDAALARDVYGHTGDVLMRAGSRLTPRARQALLQHGLAACYIEDHAGAGIVLQPAIDSAGAEAGFVDALSGLLRSIAGQLATAASQPTSLALATAEATRPLDDTSGRVALARLREEVAGLAKRVAGSVPEGGLLTDRHPEDDTVGHSAAVAAVAMRLAHALGFTEDDVVTTGLAAALHDVGLLLVPEEVRRLPANQRSLGEQRRYEDHALLGGAILHGAGSVSQAVPQVALEHHEEQSGGGYPRGLRGVNRVLRSAEARLRISLVSEVVAVADRYERLVSGAPGAQPLSPAAARRALAHEAGARLNAEVAGRFLDLLPRWPAGTEVLLHGGQFEGARAVVIASTPEEPDRPRVRVFAGGPGRDDLVEVDLATVPVVSLDLADEAAA